MSLIHFFGKSQLATTLYNFKIVVISIHLIANIKKANWLTTTGYLYKITFMTNFELAFICAFTTEEFALVLPHGLGTKDIIMRIKKIKVMFSRKMDEISLDFKAEILLLLLLL